MHCKSSYNMKVIEAELLRHLVQSGKWINEEGVTF